MNEIKWVATFAAVSVTATSLVAGYKVQKDTELAVVCIQRGGKIEVMKSQHVCILPSIYPSKEAK
jgi:hypothetical protein